MKNAATAAAMRIKTPPTAIPIIAPSPNPPFFSVVAPPVVVLVSVFPSVDVVGSCVG